MVHHRRYGIRRMLSLLLGLLFSVVGVGATLNYIVNYFGMKITLPALFFDVLVLKICLVVAALLLFLDSFSVSMEGKFQIGSTIFAIILAGIAAIPLLLDYNLLNFIPFFADLTISPLVFSIMLAFYGLYLIVVYARLKRASLFFY